MSGNTYQLPTYGAGGRFDSRRFNNSSRKG
jgi:hypothetical protein